MTLRAASSNLLRVASLLGVVAISFIPTGRFLMPQRRTPVNRNFARPSTNSPKPARQAEYIEAPSAMPNSQGHSERISGVLVVIPRATIRALVAAAVGESGLH